MPDKTKPDVREDERSFDRFDRMFRKAVSVSNQAVREKMEAEKRKRARRKKRVKK